MTPIFSFFTCTLKQSFGFIKSLPEKFAKNLIKWMTWNNGDEVCNTVNSRFCCRFSIDDGDGSEQELNLMVLSVT